VYKGGEKLRGFLIEAVVEVDECYRRIGSPVYDKEYADKMIKDMLRYDSGQVVQRLVAPDRSKVYFTIECANFRQERWESFGIKVNILEKKPEVVIGDIGTKS
jgi:hypothetical protein